MTNFWNTCNYSGIEYLFQRSILGGGFAIRIVVSVDSLQYRKVFNVIKVQNGCSSEHRVSLAMGMR